jgi:hypothetical protein
MNTILRENEVVTMGLLSLLLFIIAMIPTAIADSINPGVFPVNSKPFGHTYGEWSARWWQWAAQIPSNINPVTDKTGINCAQNQSGPVWFLAGSSGAPVFRNCVIPAGKAILFAPLNSECSTAEDSTLKTEDQLRSCAVNQDTGGDPHVIVDGVTFQSMQTYKVQSPLFSFTFPKDNIFGAPPGPTQSVSDGWYIMLQPLSLGKHTIHHYGVVLGNPTLGTQSFASDATYNLVVK